MTSLTRTMEIGRKFGRNGLKIGAALVALSLGVVGFSGCDDQAKESAPTREAPLGASPGTGPPLGVNPPEPLPPDPQEATPPADTNGAAEDTNGAGGADNDVGTTG